MPFSLVKSNWPDLGDYKMKWILGCSMSANREAPFVKISPLGIFTPHTYSTHFNSNIYLSFYLYVYLSIKLYLSVFSICLTFYQHYIFIKIDLSNYLSIYQTLYLFISLYAYVFVNITIYLSIHLSFLLLSNYLCNSIPTAPPILHYYSYRFQIQNANW